MRLHLLFECQRFFFSGIALGSQPPLLSLLLFSGASVWSLSVYTIWQHPEQMPLLSNFIQPTWRWSAVLLYLAFGAIASSLVGGVLHAAFLVVNIDTKLLFRPAMGWCKEGVTVIPSSIVAKIVTGLQQAFVVHGFDGLYDSNLDSITGPTARSFEVC